MRSKGNNFQIETESIFFKPESEKVEKLGAVDAAYLIGEVLETFGADPNTLAATATSEANGKLSIQIKYQYFSPPTFDPLSMATSFMAGDPSNVLEEADEVINLKEALKTALKESFKGIRYVIDNEKTKGGGQGFGRFS
jgi:hypothetical protein